MLVHKVYIDSGAYCCFFFQNAHLWQIIIARFEILMLKDGIPQSDTSALLSRTCNWFIFGLN